MSSCTISFEYSWPTFVRICARMRSLLIDAGPVYSTSMARIIGGPGADGGACARAITAVKSAQTEAIQIATDRGRIHPQKRCISRSAAPRHPNPRRTRPYIDTKNEIYKARYH